MIATGKLNIFHFRSQVLQRFISLTRAFYRHYIVGITVKNTETNICCIGQTHRIHGPADGNGSSKRIGKTDSKIVRRHASHRKTDHIDTVTIHLRQIKIGIQQLFYCTQYRSDLLSYRHLRRNKGRGTGGIRPIVFFGTLRYKDKCRILLPVHRIEKHLTTMCQLLLVITPPLTGTVQKEYQRILQSRLFHLRTK